MELEMKDILKRLVEKRNLEEEEKERAMKLIMSGEATMAQIGSFLTALRMKGETPEDIGVCVRIMRELCVKIRPRTEGGILLDTCGTGGDKVKTFNISTIVALILAGAGIKVAKHGNRAITSTCGSADLMEGFGVRIDTEPRVVEESIEKVGLGFMYAPLFHPAMRNVMGPRRELGFRTIFNILGPLSNPADVNVQIMGVYSSGLTEKIARVFKILGLERALVFHGAPGLDEISNIGNTKISELRDGEIMNYQVNVKDFGVRKAEIKDIKGGNLEENLRIALKILKGEYSEKMDIVLMNASAGLYIVGKVDRLYDGVELSREIIESGRPIEKLKRLIEVSGGDVEKLKILEESL